MHQSISKLKDTQAQTHLNKRTDASAAPIYVHRRLLVGATGASVRIGGQCSTPVGACYTALLSREISRRILFNYTK